MTKTEVEEILINLDVAKAKAMRPEFTEAGLLAGMHKARYEWVGLDPVLRLESGVWLREHGYSRFGMRELLPEGELPS